LPFPYSDLAGVMAYMAAFTLTPEAGLDEVTNGGEEYFHRVSFRTSLVTADYIFV